MTKIEKLLPDFAKSRPTDPRDVGQAYIHSEALSGSRSGISINVVGCEDYL